MLLGGGTVGRLKHEMSSKEFSDWVRYFNKHGRCTPVRMYDFGPALIAWKIDHALGGKTRISDYLPYAKEQESVATVDDIAKAFGAVRRG
jgi:hypothetical protein